MPTKFDINLNQMSDLRWSELGQSSLRGSLLRLFKQLDAHFLKWAQHFQAEEFAFPPFLAASQMEKLDYFKSFPHLLTIPVTLDEDKTNLEQFALEPIAADQSIRLQKLAPVKQVLTPAACYHFYDELEGSRFEFARFFTTRCVCYRREKEYSPLQRQWAFSMREIVCIASMEEAQSYLDKFENVLAEFFNKQGFPVKFENATDPFFNPRSNPKYLAQKLEPVKKEMIYDGRLSIGSLNFHRNFFGETFDIKSGDSAAFTACVAFGLERWIYMLLHERGLDESAWGF